MYTVPNTVPSVVLDIGSHTVKVGYSGEDTPCRLFGSVVGSVPRTSDEIHCENGSDAQKRIRFCGEQELLRPQSDLEIEYPLGSDGTIHDWDAFNVILDHALNTELKIDSSDFGVMMGESTHVSRGNREKLCELLFETYRVPALHLAKSAALSAFACGKTSGMVIDMGASGISVVPVFEGSVVKAKTMKCLYGGFSMREKVAELLQKKNIPVRPQFHVKRTRTGTNSIGVDEDEERVYDVESTEYATGGVTLTDSYETWQKNRVLDEVLESGILRVPERDELDRDPALPVILPTSVYWLPDGNKVEVGQERFDVGKQLFESIPVVNLSTSSMSGSTNDSIESYNGIAELVQELISKCDTTMQRELSSAVCLTGGIANMNGLYERLSQELMYLSNRTRIVTSGSILSPSDRRFAAWTGGSILATFSEFQKSWFSKAEFEENGAMLVHKKCP